MFRSIPRASRCLQVVRAASLIVRSSQILSFSASTVGLLRPFSSIAARSLSSTPATTGVASTTSRIVRPDAIIKSTDVRTGKSAIPSETDLVIYHGSGCPDGFAAAWCAWLLLGPQATYIAADHGPRAPSDIDVRGKHVVVVDYCFPAHVTARMISEAASFICLDHHATAIKELADVAPKHKALDMGMSGATLSWCFFHGHESPMPLFLRYIEDKDIWRWAYAGSREFSAAFSSSVEGTFESWSAMLARGEEGVDRLCASGAAILAYRDKLRDGHASRAAPCRLKVAPQYKGRIVNATTLASDIGNAIASQPGVDYALMWSYVHDGPEVPGGALHCSLRSASDACDVSVIAQALGGGGHKRASGFSVRGTCDITKILLVEGAKEEE